LLPAKGSVQSTGSGGAVEAAKPASNSVPLTGEKDLSFTAVFAAPGSETPQTKLAIAGDPPEPVPTSSAETPPPPKTDIPVAQETISSVTRKDAFAVPEGQTLVTLQPQPTDAKTADVVTLAVPVFGTRRATETPISGMTKPVAVADFDSAAGPRTPAALPDTVWGANPRLVAAPLAAQPAPQTGQTPAVHPANATTSLSPQTPTATQNAPVATTGSMTRAPSIDLSFSDPEIPPRPMTPAAFASSATVAPSVANVPLATTPQTTLLPTLDTQAITAQTNATSANGPSAIPPIVSTYAQVPLMAQLAVSTAPVVDSTSRKPSLDRTIATDPVFQTLPAVKPSALPSGAQLGTALIPVQPVSVPVLDASKNTAIPLEPEPLVGVRGDVSLAPSTSQVQSTHSTAPLPQHIARQIAEALQSMPNRPVQISLNPEELGRVRLALSTSEAGIVVNVLAERQETVELMRRHIASLESAFQDIGYSDIAFSFSGGEQTQTDAGDGDGSNPSKSTADGEEFDDPVTIAPQINLTIGTQAGLDIRL
jgi:flagellar hook-length control protein FliK